MRVVGQMPYIKKMVNQLDQLNAQFAGIMGHIDKLETRIIGTEGNPCDASMMQLRMEAIKLAFWKVDLAAQETEVLRQVVTRRITSEGAVNKTVKDKGKALRRLVDQLQTRLLINETKVGDFIVQASNPWKTGETEKCLARPKPNKEPSTTLVADRISNALEAQSNSSSRLKDECTGREATELDSANSDSSSPRDATTESIRKINLKS